MVSTLTILTGRGQRRPAERHPPNDLYPFKRHLLPGLYHPIHALCGRFCRHRREIGSMKGAVLTAGLPDRRGLPGGHGHLSNRPPHRVRKETWYDPGRSYHLSCSGFGGCGNPPLPAQAEEKRGVLRRVQRLPPRRGLPSRKQRIANREGRALALPFLGPGPGKIQVKLGKSPGSWLSTHLQRDIVKARKQRSKTL